MKKFAIQITYQSEGQKKTVVLQKKISRLSDGINFFLKEINPTAEKILRAIFLA